MNRKLSLISAAIVSVGLTLSAPANAVTMNYIGQWTSTTSYAAGSVVFSGNQTFYALNASKGQNPLTAASYWKLIGTNGNTVRSGTAAPTSAIGNAGDFYIETTNKRLYGPKTATGWPTTFTALIGPTGPQGPIGATGPKGATGATGPQGPAGPQGATGPAGPQGPMGVAGPAGPQGTAGAAGATGKSVLNGTVAPISTIGNVGDFYIETTNKRLYGPKTATGWPTTYTALIGPTGPQGPIGLTGPAGQQGAAGATGPQGPIGAPGPAGPKGATGPQGPQGPAGNMSPGSKVGEISFWDGSSWKLLQPPNPVPIAATAMAKLSFCKGLPTWSATCGFIQRGDSYYFIVDGTTWKQAEANAAALGGHLVTIEDQAENDFLVQTFAGKSGEIQGLWIGLTDELQEGKFIWTSGSNSTYRNFAGGEPNNGNGNGESYGHMWTINPWGYPVGSWNDIENLPGGPNDYRAFKGIAEVSIKNPNKGTYTPPSGPFQVGDKGPAGGTVFFVEYGGYHGLEVAPNTLGVTFWGCMGTSIPSAQSSTNGATNTVAIVENCAEGGIAAKMAGEYSYNGFTDWYLPSKVELDLLLQQSTPFSIVSTDTYYWSSSEFNQDFAWLTWCLPTTTLPNCGWLNHLAKDENRYRIQALPIRAF